ncbi:MAG: hypothetical protein RIC56_02895 [Pseudomonadales bacterium]
MAGVGDRIVYEDGRIRVWEFDLEPGQRTPLHTHVHDYVFYVIEGSTLEVFDHQDRLLGAFEAPTGAVFPFRVEGERLVPASGEGPSAPVTHSARNAGATRYREILIETK